MRSKNHYGRPAAFLVIVMLITACNGDISTSTQPPVPTSTLRVIPTNPVVNHTTSTPLPSPIPTQVPGPNEYIVIAQLNLWYFGEGCNGGFETHDCSGTRSTPLNPALGDTYTSADPAVIEQQIEWAAAYGVDAFSLEWTTPRGVGHSLEDNIDDRFLKASNLHKIRWCIFDDFVLRLMQTPGLGFDPAVGIDFDDPAVYDAFVSDFEHFARKYFDEPQYLTIDGRPIVYLWNTWQYQGNVAGAVQEARARALALGYDVYIVGDEVQAQVFNPQRAALWDAHTAFTFVMAGVPLAADVGAQSVLVDQTFTDWQAQIAGMKVAGREDLVNFQPGWAPQFDNRLFDPGNAIYVPALSKDQVTAMALVARNHAEPAGSSGQMLIWLNTFNNWAETTTVEPTSNLGPKYPAGNYQYDMLEVIREVFGPQVFPAQE